jgi:hypothetical protein
MKSLLLFFAGSFLILAPPVRAQTDNFVSQLQNETVTSFLKYTDIAPSFFQPNEDLYRPMISIPNDTMRFVYTYYPGGLLHTRTKEVLRSGIWMGIRRETSAYDNNGLLIELLTEIYFNNQWEADSRLSYTYNSSGQVVTYLAEIIMDGVTEYFFLTTSTYQEGLLTEQLTKQRHQNDDWINIIKFSIDYISAGGRELTMQNWKDSTWVNHLKWITKTDPGFNLTESLQQEWTGSWVNIDRYRYNYDSNLMTEKIYETWAGEWVNNKKEVYSYNQSEQKDSVLQLDWAGTEWANDGLYLYEYDLSGNLLRDHFLDWVLSQWENSLKIEYTYDINGNGIHGASFQWASGWYPVEGYLQITYNNGRDYLLFIETEAVDVEYDIFTQVDDDILAVSEYILWNNYPNPFNPGTIINYSISDDISVTITIYDILGREIKILLDEVKSAGTYQIEWNAENLPSGVYFCRMKAGEYTSSKKMVLLR